MKQFEIVKLIEQICLSQPNVHKFIYGDVYQLNHSEEVEYSVMCLTNRQHSEDVINGQTTYRFALMYVDRLWVSEENRLDIYTNGKETIQNVLDLLMSNAHYLVNNYTFNDVAERFNDVCGVVFADIEIVVPTNDCAPTFNPCADVEELQREISKLKRDKKALEIELEAAKKVIAEQSTTINEITAQIENMEVLTASENGLYLPQESIGFKEVYVYVEESTHPYNEIWYRTTSGNIVEPFNVEAFDGARIISNTLGEDGKGVIKFDRDLKVIGDSAFKGANIVSLEMPNSVELIGEGVFAFCSDLESIVLSKRIRRIAHSAFLYCERLEKIEIPNGTLYCDEDWFNNLDETMKRNLGNLIYWRRVYDGIV